MTDVSTGTCGGRVTCNFLKNYYADKEVEGEGGKDEEKNEEDPLFMYEEITAFLISLRPQIRPQEESSENDVIEAKLPLRSSLFDHVSPYLQFQLHSSIGIDIPFELTNSLKWKLTPTTPKIVRKIVANTGYGMTRDARGDWCGSWCEAMFAYNFECIKNHQKINHFPGAYEIGNKDRLCRNLNRLANLHGKKKFDFIPDTYVVPEDLPKIRANWQKCRRNKWIVKPPASSCGRGIFLVSEFAKIARIITNGKMVVQRYLSRPKLIDNTKFDLRIYVLVTSFDPLKIYVYREGLVRFACDSYRNSPSNLDNHFMHLTNYSVNRSCSRYECNDTLDSGKGHKWSLRCLWSYLNKQGVDAAGVLNKIHDIIVKTIISCESSINSFTRTHISSRYSCYELLGFDVLLDENTKPWLLEVNISPSLQTSSPLDEAVKGPLVRDTLNIVGYQVPDNIPRLSLHHLQAKYNETISKSSFVCQDHQFYDKEISRMARRKQTFYSRICNRNSNCYVNSILDALTPDDARHLMRYEDELEAIGDFTKIFPTSQTRKYFKYFAKVSYYNLLFDAWEKTYGSDNTRENAIERLRNLSKIKYHLAD
ncbi:tubulin polyglutamylase TTLL4-like [Venturia canescens]|uniref:tubulin polyglutamylase TTLL4-like n=1 Tax=Venturia canescens TaxID=32260 RepID=UPI001C9D5CCE|nr:tubulin polyglutamylase TTLL4-like [Venturia canescens]